MPEGYRVDRTRSTTYLDQHNDPIHGYEVYITLIDFDEGHRFNVPKLDDKLIEERALELLAAREKLAELGS